MTPDLRQLQALHAGGEELAQPFSGLPALIFDVLWVVLLTPGGGPYVALAKYLSQLRNRLFSAPVR